MDDLDFEPIIGLEVHVELKTRSKMFCGCDANWFGKPPNSVCCPVCLGLPGALPVPNRKAVEWCVMLGLALNCEIPEFSKFDRKNYFYPDLPKGYQVSQYDRPFCINGWLDIKSEIRNSKSETNSKFKSQNSKRIRIRRVHMEEDTGKLVHATVDDPTSLSGLRLRGASEKCTLIDFNRSGMPLVEIVTEPDIRSSEEAKIFLKKLYQVIRYLGISDADMEKGSMRLEPNISIRRIEGDKNTSGVAGWNEVEAMTPPMVKEPELPSYKVEVKNINSFNFAKKAIDFEVDRHIELLNRGEIPVQETRGWDEKNGITYSQRSKEEAHDYRYFPEPDIPPVRWTGDQISKIKDQICELPDEKISRFMKEYQLSEYDATILTDELETAGYFERCIKESLKNTLGEVAGKQGLPRGGETGIAPKIIANWIINKKADISKVTPKELVKLISAKQQVVQLDEGVLQEIIKKVLAANPKAVSDYKFGKQQSLMFLLGQVMRETRGQADAVKIKELLSKVLINP